MNRVVVAGVVNVEFSLPVDAFPVPYVPGSYSTIPVGVSGVGFNIASGLTALGTSVTLLTFVGEDILGAAVEKALRSAGLWGPGVVRVDGATPHSIVMYDRQGRRSVTTDLVGIGDRTYPGSRGSQFLVGTQYAILTNVGFTRPLLERARSQGLPVACDVHAIADLRDDYNRDYMSHSTVLFMSGERLPDEPATWLDAVMTEYPVCRIAVVGMGAIGCWIKVRGKSAQLVPAITPRPVVNTTGAGDALFSSFVHYHVQGAGPLEAIERAVAFAGWKVGESGGAQGFASADQVEDLVRGRSMGGQPKSRCGR